VKMESISISLWEQAIESKILFVVFFFRFFFVVFFVF
jgi:hypothetical protein